MPVTIPLTKGYSVIIDKKNLDLVLTGPKWCVKHGGGRNVMYAARTIRRNGKCTTEYMHRLIMDCPPGMEVHHIDHNSLNNREDNLKVCTRTENARWKN